jgi:acyl-CoA thioesterase
MQSLADILAAFNPNANFSPAANWLQGRTLYGGLSAALALRAAQASAQEALPPLRTAQILYVGPATEALSFDARTLRQGKSATSIAVDCLSGGAIATRAAFVFAGSRPSTIEHERAPAPQVDAPDRYPKLPALPMLPAFVGNFDIHFAGRALPMSGSDHPELVAWVRHRDAQGVDPSVALLALADCLPPATMTSFTTVAPVSSMTWTIDLARPAVSGEWFLLRASSQYAANGYSFQTMEIWDAQRRPVASGSQTVAIFA